MQDISILTIVGARPQYIKAAMVSRAVEKWRKEGKAPRVSEQIINTGQHYDQEMSTVFIDQLGLPEPVVTLKAGGLGHGAMTGRLVEELEREMIERSPDWVVLYGDTNTTLAGAIAAVKLGIPVAHVEAGLRSWNMSMPEEINRRLTDHASTLLLCPTRKAVANLAGEGLTRGVYHTGDVMFDAVKVFGEVASTQSTILQRLATNGERFALATIHRAENTDDPERLHQILKGLESIATNTMRVIAPLHPRTRKYAREQLIDLEVSPIEFIEPVSYLDMQSLQRAATLVLTDSGGMQKEAYFNGVPCITMRDQTEWVETADAGWNQVVGANAERIVDAARSARTGNFIPEYGHGDAAEQVLARLVEGVEA